jgi:hypothetical protein
MTTPLRALSTNRAVAVSSKRSGSMRISSDRTAKARRRGTNGFGKIDAAEDPGVPGLLATP